MTALPGWVLSHRHAVLALLVVVMILGFEARQQLPVQLFPDTDPPMVTVITSYPGMAAEDVAEHLSKLLEEEFAGIDGVLSIRSRSQEGLSVVEVEFHYGNSSTIGAVEIQNAINRIRATLPQTMGEPQIQEFSSTNRPIMTLALTSSTKSLVELREVAENRIRDQLSLVPGVAAVDIIGANRRQLEVQLQRDKLYNHGVSQEQVLGVLKGWNLTAAGGRIDQGGRESVVRFDTPLSDVEDVENLILVRQGEQLLRLKDVAAVQFTPEEPRSAYRHNGVAAIAVQILKPDEANTVEVADRLFAVLDELRADDPQIHFAVAEDQSAFTRIVINSMTGTVAGAILLTVLVVLLFLGDARQALIVAAAIPVTFLISFALMQLGDLELNMVTMSAIILAIGLLVDDSIVVLENIHRYLEQGLSAKTAAIKGTAEILIPSSGGTITTLAVLVPLTLLGGFIGALFQPLALTLIFALSASLIISLTLVPLMAAAWLRPGTGHRTLLQKLLTPFDTTVNALRNLYMGLLTGSLKRPVWVIATTLLLLVAAIFLLRVGGSEMMPRFDSGSFRVLVDVIPGTRLDQTQTIIADIEQALLREESVTNVSTRIGYEKGARYLGGRGAMDTHQAEISVDLTPRNTRQESQWQIMDRVRTQTLALPGVTLGVFQEQGGTARPTTSAPLIIELSGTDPVVLDRLGDIVVKALGTVSAVRDPYKDWALDRPELRLTIDKERAAELGLSGVEIARKVQRALDGEVVTRYRQRGLRDLDLVVRYHRLDRLNREGLEHVQLIGSSGVLVSLMELVTMEPARGVRLVSREDLRRTLEVQAWSSGERPLSHIVRDARQKLVDIPLPPGYSVTLTGEQKDMAEAQSRIGKALLLSILAVYLLLVIQFRSVAHPLVIMAAVPLQFIGVAVALVIAGKYLSMPALLGIVLLIGIVVNNSIILVDFARGRLAEGADIDEALQDAVETRFRPVMMTALSTVAGMLPLALELAVGSERFSPIATVIIGGILASTLLTLVIIPVLLKGLLLKTTGR
ncbi:MAG: efflux RND transporter permease subunit [Pelovirga sp.]